MRPIQQFVSLSAEAERLALTLVGIHRAKRPEHFGLFDDSARHRWAANSSPLLIRKESL
jgi:hypothetical protein